MTKLIIILSSVHAFIKRNIAIITTIGVIFTIIGVIMKNSADKPVPKTNSETETAQPQAQVNEQKLTVHKSKHLLSSPSSHNNSKTRVDTNETQQTSKIPNNLTVGTDSVVIGNVTGKVGNGSVVVGPTDKNGNTILNRPMAVGRNAKAGPDSIAIGTNAGAGLKQEIPSNIFTARGTQTPLPLNAELTNAAWEAFNKGNFEEAISSAQKCIAEFKGSADREQKELESAKAPLPQKGSVPEEIKKVIWARGLLNDVATSYYIKGRSAESLGRIEEAKQSYKEATKYTYARCWDPKGWFWSPSEAAQDRLSILK